jgi:hypothetical protein
MIKKYSQFINESEEMDSKSIDGSNNKYVEVMDEIKSMINKTIEKSGGEFKSFVESFLKTPEDVKIEGLINDSDIYDFYLKWRNDIDEILNDIKFFDDSPSELSTFGLYDYLIKGTNKSIEEFSKGLI